MGPWWVSLLAAILISGAAADVYGLRIGNRTPCRLIVDVSGDASGPSRESIKIEPGAWADTTVAPSQYDRNSCLKFGVMKDVCGSMVLVGVGRVTFVGISPHRCVVTHWRDIGFQGCGADVDLLRVSCVGGKIYEVENERELSLSPCGSLDVEVVEVICDRCSTCCNLI